MRRGKHDAAILAALGEGKGTAQIARELGCRPTYVYRRRIALGQPVQWLPGSPPRHGSKYDACIRAARLRGVSYSRIAGDLGLCRYWVGDRARKIGAEFRLHGLTPDQLDDYRLFAWKGYCSTERIALARGEAI